MPFAFCTCWLWIFIEEDDNTDSTVGNTGTGITFTLKKYTGNGKYFFVIDNDEWIVEVEKKFNEKWKVTKAYKQ